MGRLKTITRRTLLIGSAAVAGGVVFGVWKYRRPYDNPLLDDLGPGQAALTPYVRIDQQGITIIAPRAEMGQGVHTTLAALVAEELDVDLADVAVEHGPASHAYFNAAILKEGIPYAPTDTSAGAERARRLTRIPAKFLGMQVTGGSSSIPDAFYKMRHAGAAAREVLLTAASQVWDADVAMLSTRNGRVVHPDGREIRYQALAEQAALIEPPAEVTLKPPESWRILGQSQPRVDVVPKSTGAAVYAMDVRLPGLRFAAVKRNPHLGGMLVSFDASAAKAMTGVVRIVDLGDGIAAVADNTWRALKAADAVECEWAPASYPATSREMLEKTASAMDEGKVDSELRDDGDVDAALREADVIRGEYRVPLLAHATMEPMNATAWLHEGKLDIWAGTQLPTQARKDAARICELRESAVNVHTTYMGGGFGRRGEMDFVQQAAKVAKAMPGVPVSVIYSREEDMTHDLYRPAAVARFRAAVDETGPVALDLHVAAASVMESQLGRLGLPSLGPDTTIVQATWDQPYALEHFRVTGYRPDAMIPISSWRSVGASQNGFFQESILDELAYAAGRDPLDMRLDLIRHEPSRRVLESVAEMAGWGQRREAGRALGVAFVLSFGVPVAEVVEVEKLEQGIKIHNAWIAADVGIALDPRNIEAQLQGAMNFGLAAAMMGEITVTDGKVDQTNFHQFRSQRISQAPDIHVRVLENGDEIRGVGEPGLPPAAPALANAIFAATGMRIRELPMTKHVEFV